MFLTHVCLLFGLRLIGNGSDEAANADCGENKCESSIHKFCSFHSFCFDRRPLSHSGCVPYWKKVTCPTVVA